MVLSTGHTTLFYIHHLHDCGHPPAGWVVELEIVRPPALEDDGDLDSRYVWPYECS